jgi:hypothetical protein
MIFGLSNVEQEAIVWMAMIEAPSTQKTNNATIQAQDTVRWMKEELAKEKGIDAMEEFIDDDTTMTCISLRHFGKMTPEM